MLEPRLPLNRELLTECALLVRSAEGIHPNETRTVENEDPLYIAVAFVAMYNRLYDLAGLSIDLKTHIARDELDKVKEIEVTDQSVFSGLSQVC